MFVTGKMCAAFYAVQTTALPIILSKLVKAVGGRHAVRYVDEISGQAFFAFSKTFTTH